jgi:hypothetical protein
MAGIGEQRQAVRLHAGNQLYHYESDRGRQGPSQHVARSRVMGVGMHLYPSISRCIRTL